MAVLGGGKKKTRNKKKTETVTVNADGSKTVTVTKNKTTTKTKGPRRTPRPKVTAVSTLKPYGIEKQKISIPKPKISTKPIKVEPPLNMHPSHVGFRNKVKEQVAANKKEKQWQSVVRNSQPLAPSPNMKNSVPNGRGK
tara:strand:- start:49 stop:465 length:417 start_codon:yes stop_codon:yes gene_type:complete